MEKFRYPLPTATRDIQLLAASNEPPATFPSPGVISPAHQTDGSDVDRWVGSELRKRRLEQGMSAGQAAERCGSTEALVMEWEEGTARPSPKALLELADTYGVPIARLFPQE